MAERIRMAEQVAGAIAISKAVQTRITAINKIARLLEIPEEQLYKLVNNAAAEQKNSTSQQGGKNSTADVTDDAKKLILSQHKAALLLCQMALNDTEVLHWLREADCDDILSEVPGTELLSLIVHSRFNPLDETSHLAFMAGLERHKEAAFTQLQTLSGPPSGLHEARQLLYTLEIARLESLLQSTHAKLREPGLPKNEVERLWQHVRELTTLRKECLDRAKASPDSPNP
jgi:DNA primase